MHISAQANYEPCVAVSDSNLFAFILIFYGGKNIATKRRFSSHRSAPEINKIKQKIKMRLQKEKRKRNSKEGKEKPRCKRGECKETRKRQKESRVSPQGSNYNIIIKPGSRPHKKTLMFLYPLIFSQ